MFNKIVGTIVTLALIAIVAVSVWNLNQQNKYSNEGTPGSDNPSAVPENKDGSVDGSKNVACPADAKICPDGTAVGRKGPKCEFEECRMVERPKEEIPGQPFVTNKKGDKAIIWAFNTMPEEAVKTGMPYTEVSIMINGGRDIIGTYEGSCIVIDNVTAEGKKNSVGWPLLKGELTGAICWYAGGGHEVAVFEENGKIIVKTGLLDEGTAETAGTRGDFKTVASY